MDTRNKQVLLAFIFIIIVVVGGLFAWKMGWFSRGAGTSTEGVKDISLSAGAPAGWPEGLPVDMARLVEEKQLDYPDSTLYSVVYRSPEQLESIYANYKVYFEKNGYTIGSTTKTQQIMLINGSKAGDSVSVTITPEQGANRVILAVKVSK